MPLKSAAENADAFEARAATLSSTAS